MRLPRRAVAGELDEAHGSCWTARDELLAAEHARAARRGARPRPAASMRGVRRVAWNLLDAEVAVGDGRDLRQVRDRDHLGTRAEAAECLAPPRGPSRPPMPASISSKTIVSPPPTAAIASAIRESSPPEAVSATGAKGRPAFGRIRNAASSAPGRPGVPLAAARRGTRRRPSRCPAAPRRPRPRMAPPPWRGGRAARRRASGHGPRPRPAPLRRPRPDRRRRPAPGAQCRASAARASSSS